VTLNLENHRRFAQLDATALENLFELNKERIQSLLAEAAGVRVEQAIIRAEMKRREREIWS
jgi:hypothetical protein